MHANKLSWNLKFDNPIYDNKFNEFNMDLQNDTVTLSALDNAKTLEEFFQVGKKYIDCSFEDFLTAFDNISEKMSTAYATITAPYELDDDDLDLVVGGDWAGFWQKVGKITLAVIATVGALALCAATGGLAGAAVGAGLAATASISMTVSSAAISGAVVGSIAGVAHGINGFVSEMSK